MRQRSTWTPEREQELIALQKTGANRREMAEHFGLTTNQIACAVYRLNKRGIYAKAPPREMLDRKIVAHYKGGRTSAQIAHTLGITTTEVEQYLARHGYNGNDASAQVRMSEIWGMDEDARRIAIAKRAQRGARRALRAMGAA